MKQVISLALLTFTEGIRDRALLGILLISVLMLGANILFMDMFGYDMGKVMVDLNISTIVFAGLLLTFFVNINLMAKDIDKYTIYCVLAKPLSRSQYIIGKYSGLMLLLLSAIFMLTIFSIGGATIVKNSVPPVYFKSFSWVCYFQAIGYSTLMFLLLNAIVIFFSSLSSSSFLTLLFSVATYIVGQTIEEIVIFFQGEAQRSGYSSPMNESFVNVLQYIFPNLSAFDIKVMASHGKLLSIHHTVMLTGYSICYTLLLIFFAAVIFSKRELA